MTGVTGVLIKLGVRFVVFTGVFWFVAARWDKVKIERWWARPLVALVFALLDTAVYWVLSPLLDVASLGVAGFAMPLIANLVLLFATVRIFELRDTTRKWLQIDGFLTTVSLALVLALAHGAIYFALDYLPNR